MFYKAELDFLIRTFEKCRLRAILVDSHTNPERRPDMGLRYFLGMETSGEGMFEKALRQLESNRIYKLTDQFMCSYRFLLLPEAERKTVLLIGPYLTVELTGQQMMEQAEQNGVPAHLFRQLKGYYESLPVLLNENPLYAMLDSFGTRIWGEDNFQEVDINQELTAVENMLPKHEEAPRPEQTAWAMQQLEERYAYENELMRVVSQGLTHKAEMMLSGVAVTAFERRLADPVRNHKNYCIIMNTLLRKAAEEGGVHPFYLDRTSSDYAMRIERLNSTAAISALRDEMFRTYCRLVNRHSTKRYSAPVQKAIIQIDSDLGGNLNLKSLSEMQNLNASYLSALFKKETGQTITDYISQKRIQLAIRLLGTTDLQIQTIAQHCGILDVNYFSKVFKRQTGKTPKEYRREIRGQMTPRT